MKVRSFEGSFEGSFVRSFEGLFQGSFKVRSFVRSFVRWRGSVRSGPVRFGSAWGGGVAGLCSCFVIWAIVGVVWGVYLRFVLCSQSYMSGVRVTWPLLCRLCLRGSESVLQSV